MRPFNHVVITREKQTRRIGPTKGQRREIIRALRQLSTSERKLSWRIVDCGLCEIIDGCVILYSTRDYKKLAAVLGLAALHGNFDEFLEIIGRTKKPAETIQEFIGEYL